MRLGAPAALLQEKGQHMHHYRRKVNTLHHSFYRRAKNQRANKLPEWTFLLLCDPGSCADIKYQIISYVRYENDFMYCRYKKVYVERRLSVDGMSTHAVIIPFLHDRSLSYRGGFMQTSPSIPSTKFVYRSAGGEVIVWLRFQHQHGNCAIDKR